MLIDPELKGMGPLVPQQDHNILIPLVVVHPSQCQMYGPETDCSLVSRQ